ncbi:CHASE2 domain-containing protein [Synechococcus sp. MIT S1220]|uniref:CHASE2 domain-containing protein n=1 Tax=Synechococcus sp. MIT S1220 TaxID=3082549 RepID=UPI0039B03FCD
MNRIIIPLLWRLGILLPLLLLPWLSGLDSLSRQLLFQLRGPRPIAESLTLLAIDEASVDPELSEFGRWPWPRALQAELVARVLELGAQRVVFNIVHSGISPYGIEDDEAFLRRLKPWLDRVVFTAHLVEQKRDGMEEVQLRQTSIPDVAVGLSNTVLNEFGVVKAIPGLRILRERLADFPPPYPAPLAHLAAGINAADGIYGIDFLGPAGQLPLVTPQDIDNLGDGFWSNQVVVFGATAPTLGDQLETPFGLVSGSEVLVAAMSGLLEGRGFREPEPLVLGGLLLLWTLLCGWRIGAGSVALITFRHSLILIVLAAGVTVAAWSWGWWLPGTTLVLAPLLGGGIRTLAQYRVENVQRRFLKSVLSSRISPTLMQDMLLSGQEMWTQLGGRRTHCVVLFTDLVGFTARSSVMEPEALFQLLNRYFEAIAAPVLAEQGLLDKFIGDALMAEFGVPQHRGEREEALAAVRAALAMQDNLSALNVDLEREGLEPLRQGIGIHVGEVIAGNLGSSHRLEYTVIGAPVNLASRLESLTRNFPEHPILMSDAVRTLLGDEVQVESLGRHQVKGWPEPIEVFGLIRLNRP